MSFFDLFRRRKAPSLSEILRDSPEDWMPDDIAVCINPSGMWVSVTGALAYGPEDGQHLCVQAVALIEGVQFLMFERFPGGKYHADAFVKRRPDERKACTPDFKRKLKRLRPMVDA